MGPSLCTPLGNPQVAASETLIADSNSAKPVAYQPLVAVVAAMAGGIAFDHAVDMHLGAYLVSAGMAVLFWFVVRRRPEIRLGLTLLIVATAAAAWHHCRWSLYEADDIGRYAQDRPRPCCVEGTVVRGPRQLPPPEWGPLDVIPRRERTRLDLAVDAIRDKTRFPEVSGKAALYVDGAFDGAQPGDRIRVYGSLISPVEAHNPGQFDRRMHYRTQRICCMIRSPDARCVEILQPGSAFRLRRLLERLRRGGADLLDRYLGDSHSGLASAILLGARDRVDEDQRLAFQETGTVHLLAISGLHVGDRIRRDTAPFKGPLSPPEPGRSPCGHLLCGLCGSDRRPASGDPCVASVCHYVGGIPLRPAIRCDKRPGRRRNRRPAFQSD